MRYAVRLGDLMQHPMLSILFGPVVAQETLDIDKRAVDGVVVVLSCDDDRIRAIRDACQLLQERKRITLVPRFYQQTKPGAAWHPLATEKGATCRKLSIR